MQHLEGSCCWGWGVGTVMDHRCCHLCELKSHWGKNYSEPSRTCFLRKDGTLGTSNRDIYNLVSTFKFAVRAVLINTPF